MSLSEEKAKKYWRENISTILKLLFVWFIVSYGFGILFIEQLNHIEISGLKLGFWFAQNGSIYIFVVLIFVYAKLMQNIEEKYDLQEK